MRARAAVERARDGGRVALISSGDAGVYGMAGLVFDVLRDMCWKRSDSPDLRIVPSMTATGRLPAYGADCPVAVVHKATCPDQKIVTGTLADIRAKVKAAGIRSQAMILVGSVLEATDFADSRLYAPDFSHRFRKAKRQGVSG